MTTVAFYRVALVLIAVLASLPGCIQSNDWKDPGLAYSASDFKSTIKARLPELQAAELAVPFAVPVQARSLARERIAQAPAGLNPVELLVSVITDPPPAGFGLEYDWTVSATATRALEVGRGDCVSLAMLLVGLGRSLDWPIYFAEAQPNHPAVRELPDLNVLSSHMVVIVLTQDGPIHVDFLGLIDGTSYKIRPIDDLSAYAHLLNNVAAHQIANPSLTTKREWHIARDQFLRITRLQPTLGHAWNNLGIAFTRLGQFEEAELAYRRAVKLDSSFGSAARNLTIMETRTAKGPTILKGDLSR